MRNLAFVNAGIAAFAFVLSVVLWRDLSAERELTAGLRTRVIELESRVPMRVTEAPSAPAQKPTQVAAAAGIAPTPPESASTAPRVLNAIINERDMLKDPQYRKVRLAQLRLGVPQNYPGLAAALGLSAQQADQLFDLLAENQLEQMEAASGGLIVGPNGKIDEAQMREMTRINEQMRTRLEAGITTLLGGSGFAKWQDYQQTQPARLRVTQLSRTLESAGLPPLTPAQMQPLTDVMVAEQARQRQESMAIVRDSGRNGLRDPQSIARLQEESLKRQAESNRRLVDAAASQLNAQQLEALRTSLEQQLALNRATQRARQDADERNRQEGPTAVP